MSDLSRRWWVAYHRCRKTAEQRGLNFTLSTDDFRALVKRADGRCEVSGVTFNWARRSPSGRYPFAPSVDRIDSGLGYVPGNVRLVCLLVNLALNDFGLEAFLTVVANCDPERARTAEATARAAGSGIGDWGTAADFLTSRGADRAEAPRFVWRVRKACLQAGLDWRRAAAATLYPRAALEAAWSEYATGRPS